MGITRHGIILLMPTSMPGKGIPVSTKQRGKWEGKARAINCMFICTKSGQYMRGETTGGIITKNENARVLTIGRREITIETIATHDSFKIASTSREFASRNAL